MILSDISLIMALAVLLFVVGHFLFQSYKNRELHAKNSIEYIHEQEHFTIGFISFFSCLSSFVLKVIHSIKQYNNALSDYIEYFQNGTDVMIVVCIILAIRHIAKESNPEHPFYIITKPMGVNNNK